MQNATEQVQQAREALISAAQLNPQNPKAANRVAARRALKDALEANNQYQPSFFRRTAQIIGPIASITTSCAIGAGILGYNVSKIVASATLGAALFTAFLWGIYALGHNKNADTKGLLPYEANALSETYLTLGITFLSCTLFSPISGFLAKGILGYASPLETTREIFTSWLLPMFIVGTLAFFGVIYRNIRQPDNGTNDDTMHEALINERPGYLF